LPHYQKHIQGTKKKLPLFWTCRTSPSAASIFCTIDFAAKTVTCIWRSGGIKRSFRNFTLEGTASSAPLTPEIRRIACRRGVFAVNHY
jgi:hypothetical protein